MRASTSTKQSVRPWRKTLLIAMSSACVAALVSCGASDNRATADSPEGPASVSETNQPDSAMPTGISTPLAEPVPVDDLQQSFEAMRSVIAGEVGVAIASSNGVRSFGSWSTGPAWSTIKVPLAIAALRHSSESAAPLVVPAIRASDNDAAEALWSQLGQPSHAAQSVGAVLAETGDTATVVQSEKTRTEFTAFGQTNWSLVNQATFMSKLPCLNQSDSVITDMRNVGGNQQWGLAGSSNAAVKGGWGPSPEGNYLVRQIALVETDSGTVGIAIAALPSDGGFQTGATQLDALSKWVVDHLGSFPGAQC